MSLTLNTRLQEIFHDPTFWWNIEAASTVSWLSRKEGSQYEMYKRSSKLVRTMHQRNLKCKRVNDETLNHDYLLSDITRYYVLDDKISDPHFAGSGISRFRVWCVWWNWCKNGSEVHPFFLTQALKSPYRFKKSPFTIFCRGNFNESINQFYTALGLLIISTTTKKG